MTNDEPRKISVGDRFEDRDSRSAGRIVEVREIKSQARIRVEVEVHPKNPSAIGRSTWVTFDTLHTRYRRISR